MRALLHLARVWIGTRRAAALSTSSNTAWSRLSSLTRRTSSSAINRSQASGLSVPARFAVRGWCNTTSEAPFDSKSGTQFLLPVDFHGVGRVAGNPVYRHRMPAQQSHPQGFDMFGVPARVGVKGAARNPIPANSVVFAIALGFAGRGEQHGKPDGDRFAWVCLRQPPSNGSRAGRRTGSREAAVAFASPAARTGHSARGHPPLGGVQASLFRGFYSRWSQPVCRHSLLFPFVRGHGQFPSQV